MGMQKEFPKNATEHLQTTKTVIILITLTVIFCSTGCTISNGIMQLSSQELSEFENAGPIQFSLDSERLSKSSIKAGPYRVGPGDLIELQMPRTLQIVSIDTTNLQNIEEIASYTCRVSQAGTISLPIAGDLKVAGNSLVEIEEAVKAVYCPKYVVIPPAVVTKISEYKKPKVTIVGAVKHPGVYEIRSDQMSLVSALMEAGGIVDEGATVIHISHSIEDSNDVDGETKPMILPVKGLNTPFADAALQDGDTIEVKGLNSRVFTVMGLVKRQGSFPYPGDTKYNLVEALAFAGGVDEVADPHYVRIYRQTAGGKIVDAAFSIKQGKDFGNAINVGIKPGDVIAVEQTARTKMNLILADILNIQAGFGASYVLIGGKDVRKYSYRDN